MLLILPFLSLIALSDAKVDFTYSMLFDERDLNGVAEIPLERCVDGGCSLFISASNQAMEATKNLFVYNHDSLNRDSLYDYASGYDTTGRMKPLQLAGTGYSIQNLNAGNIGPIAIYHVSANAPLYKTTNTVEMFDGLRMNRADKAISYVTVLNPEPYDIFVRSLDNYLSAYVRATGFDNNYQRQPNPDNCQILLDQNSDSAILLHINSPIITIAFEAQFNTQICVRAQPNNGALLDYPGIATSQGYVGCQNNKWQVFRSSAYTSPPFELHDSSNVDRSMLLNYVVNTKDADQVMFTINQVAGGSYSFPVRGENVMNQRTDKANKITIAMDNKSGSSYLVKYSPQNGQSLPTGEGICANYVPPSTTTDVSSTTTTTPTTTTSGAKDLSSLLRLFASILFVLVVV